MASDAPPGDGANRRKFVRVPLTSMMQYRVESMEDLLEDPTVDVSEGGLFLRTERPKPIGTRILFKLQLNNGTRVLEGLAVVARVVTADTGRTPGMGLVFAEMDEPSRDALAQLLVDLMVARGG